jgi:hypothetical protein
MGPSPTLHIPLNTLHEQLHHNLRIVLRPRKFQDAGHYNKESPTVGRCFEPLKEWQQVATDVRGKSLPAGHYIPEKVPELLLTEALGFLL